MLTLNVRIIWVLWLITVLNNLNHKWTMDIPIYSDRVFKLLIICPLKRKHSQVFTHQRVLRVFHSMADITGEHSMFRPILKQTSCFDNQLQRFMDTQLGSVFSAQQGVPDYKVLRFLVLNVCHT